TVHVRITHEDRIIVDDRHGLRRHLLRKHIGGVHDPKKISVQLMARALERSDRNFGLSITRAATETLQAAVNEGSTLFYCSQDVADSQPQVVVWMEADRNIDCFTHGAYARGNLSRNQVSL